MIFVWSSYDFYWESSTTLKLEAWYRKLLNVTLNALLPLFYYKKKFKQDMHIWQLTTVNHKHSSTLSPKICSYLTPKICSYLIVCQNKTFPNLEI